MPELGTYGSVRWVPGNGHPYRDHNPQQATTLRRAASRSKRELSFGVFLSVTNRTNTMPKRLPWTMHSKLSIMLQWT